MKQLFFILFLFLSVEIRTQSLWNDTIPLGYPKVRITDLISDDDTITIYGIGFNNAVEFKQGLVIAQLDTNGNILNNLILLDSLGDKLAIDDNWGKIIKTKDGGYAATAAPFVRNGHLLIKLNHNLDVEFIREYPDTINPSNYFYIPIEVPGGYFLYGSIQLPNLKSVGIIKYVDEGGGLIWEKQYDYAPHGTWVVDMARLKDSTYVFITAEALTQYSIFVPQSFRAAIYYVNLSGEITGAWKSEADPEIGYLRKVISVEEDGFITYGMQLQQIINETVLIGQPTLTRFNTDFQQEWIHHFGLVKPLDWELTLRDFTKTVDSNFIGAGRTYIEDIGESGRKHGWVYKFSATGDIVWERSLSTVFPDHYPYGGELFGIGTLSSGSIVAGGYAETGQSLHCWIVKLTNDGCMDTLFCQSNPVNTPLLPVENHNLRVFPNPATTTVHIIYDQPLQSGLIKVFDIYGRVISTTSMSSNLATTLHVGQWNAGVYHIALYNGATCVDRTRLVIAAH